jgi:hypothetical protein
VSDKKIEMYDEDFYLWTIRQASLLRTGRFNELDLEHVAEEIESIGKQLRGELGDALTLLQATALIHWSDHATELSFKTMEQVRSRAIDLLKEYPGLRCEVEKLVKEGWVGAKSIAAAGHNENEIKFPASCPWTVTEMLTECWLPKVGDKFFVS